MARPPRVDPPAELRQHNELAPATTTAWNVTGVAERAETTRVVDQTTLDWLLARSLIDAVQHRAGCRFAALWRAAGYDPRVTIPWERVISTSRPAEMPERQAAAAEVVKHAMTRMGLRTAGIVQVICCAGLRVGDAASVQGAPERVTLTILTCGLDMLVAFFGERASDSPGR